MNARPVRSALPDLSSWLSTFVQESSFLAKYPYYAHVLAGLVPVADPSVPHMGVSLHASPGRPARYFLHVNVDAFLREPQYLRGILLHELHHIVLGHLAHPKFFGAARPELMQLAQETSANEHLDEPLPSPVLWQHFERFGLRAGQSTLERYALLCAAHAEGEEPLPKRDTKPVDEHRWSDRREPPPGGVEQTRQLIETARDRGADDAERARKARPESALLAGQTPDALIADLVGTDQDPDAPLDWRAALRAFVARSRAPVHTWSRPSRRFPARIGEVPGRTYRLRPVQRPTLLVALDTSLSMTAPELAEVARQLRPLGELARLVIAESDSKVTRVYPFGGRIERVKGRGGTDLRPVFAPELLRAHAVDGVVYFTDGDGAFPDAPPPVPVLWVLTKPRDFACPWGQRAQLALGRREVP